MSDTKIFRLVLAAFAVIACIAVVLAVKRGTVDDGRDAPAPVAEEADATATAAAPAPATTAPDLALPPQENPAVAALAVAEAARAQHERVWQMDQPAPDRMAAEETVTQVAESEAVRSLRYQPTEMRTECRASLCRIETRFSPSGGGGDWTARLLQESAGMFDQSSTVTLPLPGGDRQVVIYAYRKAPPAR